MDVMVLGQPFQGALRLATGAIQLGTIAGGQDGGFADTLAAGEFGQGRLQLLGGKRYPLAQGDGCAFMIEAERE